MSSIHLHQSKVTLEQPFTQVLLNLQANILKFHGRKFAHHLFFHIKPEKHEEAKKWISDFAYKKITSSLKQLADAERRNIDPTFDGGTIYNLSLSNHGYKTLNIHSSIQENKVFKNGMQASADFLGDKFEDWDPAFKESEIDLLIIVADDKATKAKDEAKHIIDHVSAFAECLLNQRGNVLKMADTNVGIEHFGYADGISQPMYLADEISAQSQPRKWDDTTNLDMLLVEEKDGTSDCYGSYFVFRKLEQNVKGFKISEGDLPPDHKFPQYKKLLPDVKDSTGNINSDLSGSMIVGRSENSTPVTKNSLALDTDPDSKHLDNDFDYSDDLKGLKCPFHAHIRIVNPRNGNTNQDPVEVRSHRITRRAIPWDDNDPKRISDDTITAITDKMLDDNQPEGQVGLLFQCYQSDIETHFEELQGQWANTGVIDNAPGKPKAVSIGQDSLITQGTDAPRTIPTQWNEPAQSAPFKFSGFITTRGGEYFYTPSIQFLKNL